MDVEKDVGERGRDWQIKPVCIVDDTRAFVWEKKRRYNECILSTLCEVERGSMHHFLLGQ